MVGVLLISLAMAFALVQTRSRARSVGVSGPAATLELRLNARKTHRL